MGGSPGRHLPLSFVLLVLHWTVTVRGDPATRRGGQQSCITESINREIKMAENCEVWEDTNEPPTDQNLIESMETTAEGMEVGGPTGESEAMSQDEVCSNSEDMEVEGAEAVGGAGDVCTPEVGEAGDMGMPEVGGAGGVDTLEVGAGDVCTPDVRGAGDVGMPEVGGTGDVGSPEVGGAGDVGTLEVGGVESTPDNNTPEPNIVSGEVKATEAGEVGVSSDLDVTKVEDSEVGMSKVEDSPEVGVSKVDSSEVGVSNVEDLSAVGVSKVDLSEVGVSKVEDSSAVEDSSEVSREGEGDIDKEPDVGTVGGATGEGVEGVYTPEVQRGDTPEEEEEDSDDNDDFPDTLEGFGYKFTQDGALRHIKTNEPFEFVVKKNDRSYNQRHYEAIGEVITEEVYKLLETRGKLKRYPLPVDASADEPKSFFFMSDGAMESDKLLILIHGSGVVRAGQWARSLIINHSVDSGTQLPYIERGMKEGYGIAVLNTNLNYVDRNPIRENYGPEEHANHVWKNFIIKSKAKRIDIVAHSFGGVVTVDLMCKAFTEFQERVHKIAFTDSVHSLYSARVNDTMRNWIVEHARNWVQSLSPLDTPTPQYSEREIPCVSAGTPKHVETSWKAFESVFGYFSED